jgi:hypothetical protein
MLMITQLAGFGVGISESGVGGIDAFTKLMLSFDGADGATAATDASASAHTVAFVNGAQLDTAEKKFGSASLLCGDGVDDYIYIEDHADLAFGTGDFTFDWWMKRAAVSGAQENFMGQSNSALTGGYHVGFISAANTFVFGMNDEAYLPAGPATALNNTNWNHIAVEREGNNLAVAVNGVWGTSVDVTGQTYTDTATRFAIGQLGEFTAASSYNGWVDEFRISKGIARWSPGVAFTPPTAAYS